MVDDFNKVETPKKEEEEKKCPFGWITLAFVLIVGLLGGAYFAQQYYKDSAKPAFVYIEPGTCGESIPCADIKAELQQYASTLGYQFKTVSFYQGQIDMPGFYVLTDKTMTLIYGLQKVGDPVIQLCSIFNTTDLCEKAQVYIDQKETEVVQNNTVPVTKTEKPDIELFVMSHCPYGLQMEKGMLPVLDLLGDSVDFHLRNVYYIMHGDIELNEEIKQYCIQNKENEKFLPYLKCFAEKGNSTGCSEELNITTTVIDSCIKLTDEFYNITEDAKNTSTWIGDRYPRFFIDKDANIKYNVKGSPHLVVNGDFLNIARDPETIKKAICERFIVAPEACKTILPSTAFSAGFGYTESDTTTLAQCG